MDVRNSRAVREVGVLNDTPVGRSTEILRHNIFKDGGQEEV